MPPFILPFLLQTANPADLLPLREMAEWGNCTGGRAIALDRPSLTPDQVADAALAACTAQERAYEDAQIRIYARHRLSAEEARREVRGSRQRSRAALSSAASERRGLPPTVDTVMTRAAHYGQCIREHIRPGISGPDPADALIDAAFAACVDVQRWVLELAPPMPPEQLQAGMNASQNELRAYLLREIAAARTAR